MSEKNFFKDNFILIVGLTLPVLLMIGFMVASVLPRTLANPPKYDMVFSMQDYRHSSAVPVTVLLVVKDGVLKAQYTKLQPNVNGTYYNNSWRKLYLYEAASQKVRELSFGLPDEIEKIVGKKEEVVEATKHMKLDTSISSPDGYELSSGRYRRSGLFGELFWGWSGRSGEMVLKKGASSVRLATGDNTYPFYYGGVKFTGWVVGKN
ncbi:hypothetical protein OAO01_08415, partial [Oligoflexia bacterium]|nr:hypothetical protein [Oligoflexia bacterium]